LVCCLIVTSTRIRTLVVSLAAVVVMPLSALLAAPPASATTDCVNVGSQPWSLCVDVWYGDVWGYLWFPIIPEPTAPYIMLMECDSAGGNCGIVPGSVTAGRQTPHLTPNSGSRYKACADFYDGWNHVMDCSPTVPG
jgi:hypothetical protein